MTTNICVISGEASGDLHGALLVQALRETSSAMEQTHFWGTAGPVLRGAGVESIVDVEDLAVFGVTEIFKHYVFISKAYKKLLHAIATRKPQAVIFIDYPAFNLRLLQDVYALGITTIYHIPPKIWAHGAKRGQILKRNAHLVTSILPFEADFFASLGVPVTYVGNPLKDNIDAYIDANPISKVANQIGILPGSRKSEIRNLLPLLVEAFIELRKQLEVTAKIPIANTLNPEFVKDIVLNTAERCGKNKEWVDTYIIFGGGNSYEVMQTSSYAWVCSGTAALETAFFCTPLSVVYKTSAINAYLIRKFATIKYVSLVNLIADKEIIPEFLQENATVSNLVNHAVKAFTDDDYYYGLVDNLENIRSEFPNNAVRNAANSIVNTIQAYALPIDQKFKKHQSMLLSRTV